MQRPYMVVSLRSIDKTGLSLTFNHDTTIPRREEKCQDGEVIVKPPAHLGHAPGADAKDEGRQGREPWDRNTSPNIRLESSHGVSTRCCSAYS
jgi:hypothetical protein